MAFVSSSSPDQQDPTQNPGGQNPLSQQAPITSAPNASGAGKATGQPSNSGPSQPFTNLSSYLTANAPQIQAEGQQITSGLNSQYNQVNNDINTAGTNFNSQVNSGYAPLNQGVIDSFNANPTTVANDPTQAAAFKGMYGDNYTGPTSFESTPDYLNLTGEVQNATTNAQNLQTPAGIQGYFSASSPTYTQGMGTLDSALLTGNPDVVSSINTAAKPFTSLPGYLTSAAASGDSAVQNAVQQSQAAKAAAGAAGAGAVSRLGTTLNQQLSDANTSRDAYNKAISANLPVAQSDRAALLAAQQAAIDKYTGNVNNMAGSTQNAAPILAKLAQSVDPASFLSKLDSFLNGQSVVNAPTMGEVANADQFQEDAALKQLLGPGYNPYLDQGDVSKAGSYTTPALPGSVPDVSGETQFIGDIGSLYGNPYGMTNANTPGGWQTATPQQIAQAVLSASSHPGQGVNPDADTIAALKRLAANSYSGR